MMKSDDLAIEVDGIPVTARPGQMLIEATDAAGIYIPRFCYHPNLSIAANCRMCLVEVDSVPKPVPACATPVQDGMKAFTRSPKAIAAQKATMEFLLINHPLDCPICDQGGECELQDLAVGYGGDVSRYTEGKRAVLDKDLGPLISIDMTRCVHCTRCVRFGQEITGMRQLGTTQRGENIKIETYVEQSIDHELSANIIDLCLVGALNNKPYQYSARAWELEQRETVSPHDCVGSNLYAHVVRGVVKRITPRYNQAVNETWLSDRDRFSYQGVYSGDRLLQPRLKTHGAWHDIDWQQALDLLVVQIAETEQSQIGVLALPSVTLEEAYLLTRIAEHLGTSNMDHRVNRRDFTDQDQDPLFPWLGCEIADLETKGAIFVVGSNIRKEAPLLAHRLRKAALAGSQVSFASTRTYEYHHDVLVSLAESGLVGMLAGVAVAAADGELLPDTVSEVCNGVVPSEEQKRIAESLRTVDDGLVLVGNLASRHPAFSIVRALSAVIAELTGTAVGYLSEGANTAGAHLVGLLPHRMLGGTGRVHPGHHAAAMVNQKLDLTLLVNLEPDADLHCTSDAASKLSKHSFLVALTPYVSKSLLDAANLLLPIGTFLETSGTYVNIAGTRQSFEGAGKPVGEARPGWKVLWVLGNLLEVAGFDYLSSEQIRDEILERIGQVRPDNRHPGEKTLTRPNGLDSPALERDIPIYSVDGLVRRASALQKTPDALRACSDTIEEQNNPDRAKIC